MVILVSIFTQQKFHHRESSFCVFTFASLCNAANEVGQFYIGCCCVVLSQPVKLDKKREKIEWFGEKFFCVKCQSVKQWDPLMSRCWCMANSVSNENDTQIVYTSQSTLAKSLANALHLSVCARWCFSVWIKQPTSDAHREWNTHTGKKSRESSWAPRNIAEKAKHLSKKENEREKCIQNGC